MQTKQKRTQKQSYKTHPLLLETEATLMFQQMTYIDADINFISLNVVHTMQKLQSADANVLISQYQLLIYYRCISSQYCVISVLCRSVQQTVRINFGLRPNEFGLIYQIRPDACILMQWLHLK